MSEELDPRVEAALAELGWVGWHKHAVTGEPNRSRMTRALAAADAVRPTGKQHLSRRQQEILDGALRRSVRIGKPRTHDEIAKEAMEAWNAMERARRAAGIIKP